MENLGPMNIAAEPTYENGSQGGQKAEASGPVPDKSSGGNSTGDVRYCRYCGAKISLNDGICPHCGHSAEEAESVVFHLRKSQLKIAAIVFIVLFIVCGTYLANRYILWGNDKTAYDLMVACADNFEDPSSLRLISGTIGAEKDCMWAKVRARNGLGYYSSANIFFHEEGWVLATDDEWCNEKEFNAAKVNRIYERRYG